MEDSRLIIIGNGIAGVTTARHVRKRSNRPITIISSESQYFYSRTALMYIYMGHMKFEHTKGYEDNFWKKNRIELIFDHVTEVHPEENNIKLRSGSSLNYSHLVIASGSKTATYDWPGLQLQGVQGLYHLQDLQKMNEQTDGIERAAVVGGGLIGIEMVEMLHSRGIHTTFIIREPHFWGNILPKEEAMLVESQLSRAGIEVRLNTELKALLSDDGERLNALETGKGEKIACEFVGIATGVKPNIDFIKTTSIEIDRGILVNDRLQTNHANIFAVGDCAQLRQPLAHRKAIEAVWYSGKMMGEVGAANICGDPTPYRPGVWFNSAKFLNLEYQTYGSVPAELAEGENSLLWKSDQHDHLLRLVYDEADQSIKGINCLGIRFDHHLCDQWLREAAPITKVIEELQQADFNPEFTNLPYDEMKHSFRSQIKSSLYESN